MADMLIGFSKEVQTLITTHCAHFVPRSNTGTNTYVVDKQHEAPFSTTLIGTEYELARQTLGVSLLDSMSMYPLNLVVEGPSDEILLQGALKMLLEDSPFSPADVKFFPAGNATSATYLFESIRNFSDRQTIVKLIIDGDEAGRKALDGLNGRAKRDAIKWDSNKDYFQLPLDIENLLSDKVKRQLKDERPAQVQLVENVNGKITSFKVLENKKSNAIRALKISDKDDLANFKLLFDKIAASMA